MTVSQFFLATPAHHNQQLFSDYYLNYILPTYADWRLLVDKAAVLLEQLQEIWAAFVPGGNEAQTEDDLIKPVLQALGHTFEIQAALRTPDGTKKPDYIFYRDAAARDALKGATLDDTLPTHGCIAVGDAKYWDRPLDMTLKLKSGDAFSNKNPAFQIHFYMQHSGAEWGILTNGRLWRLYHKETAHKLDRYYEIDLPALLKRNDPRAFLYFYAFFHRSAFDDHPLGLRTLLRASTEFARGISDNLKEQVYDALRCIAQGFLDYPPNRLGYDPATLRTIYDHSLIVLYRLLFIFYAEARDLLSLHVSKQYRKFYSLNAMKREIVNHDVDLLPDSATYWPRLRTLFNFINQGSPPLNIAIFNGGLFDPAKYPFLEEKSVGDGRLIQAIDMLARVDGKFIDYRDLAERHLGTIYEGLLEFHLEAIAPEQQWIVALLNDKGERKTTGSYYTPDYIVKYIVDQTVGPALRRAVAGLEDDAAKLRAVLKLNLCDPAMGSGHFLVEATEYIARFLVDLALTPEEGTNEADLAYWKRRVAQSCIYGVDLNPLAVDLAKLSLWLATVAQDRPLSFLDHHLRCGNALIGARLADLDVGPATPQPTKAKRATTPTAQLALFSDEDFRRSISSAVDSMWLIETKEGNTVDEVKEQERIYLELRSTLTRKYGRLANLATAKHFGLNVPPELSNPLSDYASGRAMAALKEIDDLLQQADAIAAERRFFHWELEFPEVFFDRHGTPLGDAAGFDVVVGNPPYANAWSMTRVDSRSRQVIEVFLNKYNLLEGHWDLYTAFIVKTFDLLKLMGWHSFIIPDAFAREKYAKSLREHILRSVKICEIMHFEGLNVFKEVSRHCIIYVIRNEKPDPDTTARVVSPLEVDQLLKIEGTILQQEWLQHESSQIRLNLAQGQIRNLITKMAHSAIRIGEFCYVMVGATTHSRDKKSFKKNDIVTKEPRGNAKKFFDGSNMSRYRIVWDGRYIDYRKDEMYGPRVPKLFESPKIVIRDVTGANETLLVSYDDEGLYCDHLVTCVTYYENLEGTDALTSFQGYSRLSKPYPALQYVTALVASRAMTWYFREVFATSTLQGSYSHTYPQQIRAFPIRRIAFTTPDAERAARCADGLALYAAGQHTELLHFCKERLAADPEQSDVVHDLLAHLAQQMLDLHTQRAGALEDLLLDLEGVLEPEFLERLARLYTPPRPPPQGDKAVTARQSKYAAALAAATQQLGDLATRPLELRDDIGALSEAQWKWLLKERLKHKLGSMAELVKVYRTRQPAIAALDQRIAATDHLIDQIVYALYGLSDEEIALVEGS
ncbi:Eco57I restriction-modification methylase domain-containing protein [Candidatus Viridilinea mediisalina]|uniref:site-specific DNA-methyltransferase (adenine-specific) n=1 Tax=Candidatus Viridilinea mediisalina TaxID=2024553 RepID=A0A2A6RIN0_9CHLR|nr:TaqI-like C-terminal specificity domain-containing protein [Candidatus Viridilinea mediisalina]PDW02984.1 hypothetical protein CJ255_11220 [Candidatus Viridilinea mediisalina]